MRAYKVVILANLAFALGLLGGYVWWDREVDRLRRELDAARAAATRAGVEQGSVTGIVRAVLAEERLLVVTHEPFGTMPAMTMGFRVKDRASMTGLAPGDRIEFTLARDGKELVLVDLRKDK
jgi:Cu/Ag efflux protein CusF